MGSSPPRRFYRERAGWFESARRIPCSEVELVRARRVQLGRGRRARRRARAWPAMADIRGAGAALRPSPTRSSRRAAEDGSVARLTGLLRAVARLSYRRTAFVAGLARDLCRILVANGGILRLVHCPRRAGSGGWRLDGRTALASRLARDARARVLAAGAGNFRWLVRALRRRSRHRRHGESDDSGSA